MKVTINQCVIDLFQGAKVREAVHAYFTQNGQKMPRLFPQVTDGFGNHIDQEGALSEGNHLFIVPLKKQVRSGLSVALVLFLLICGFGSVNAQSTYSSVVEKQVTILAINDMHANIDFFPQFATLIDSLRQIYPDLLLFAAGDNQTGNPINDQYPQKGLPIVELMNTVGFNLSAVGNHEFDSQPKGFSYLQKKAGFGFVCANLEAHDSLNYTIKPYQQIVLPNGLKLAVLGLLDINQNGIPDTHPDNVKGVTFSSPVDAARKYLWLKDQNDLLVVLSHCGFENDVKLASDLPEGIDLIVGGHSHTRIDKELIIKNTLITQAENKLKYATLIKIGITPDGHQRRNMELISIRNIKTKQPEVQIIVDRFNDNPRLNEVIAHSTDEFPNYHALGYLMADALRWGSKCDIALVNPGGVRIDYLPKGDFRILDVFRLDPFGNDIITFRLSGREIIALMKAAYPIDENKPLYVSGIYSQLKTDPSGSLSEIRLFNEKNQPLEPDQTYTVAMNSYMAVSYKYEHQDQGQSQFITTADNMIAYLRGINQIKSYRNETRITLNSNTF